MESNDNCIGAETEVEIIESVSISIAKWEIRNFSNLCNLESGRFIQSGIFSSGKTNILHNWQLRLYPTGYSVDDNEYLSVILKKPEIRETNEFCKIFILDNNNQIVHKVRLRPLNDTLDLCGSKQFILRSLVMDTTKGILADDILKIFCEIEVSTIVSTDLQNTQLRLRPPGYPHSYKSLDNFEELLDNKKFSDVKFIVNGRSIPGHNAVLSCKSPTFYAMYEPKMNQSPENKVKINDVDYVVFKELLRFIYSGKVLDIKNFARDLLPVAIKCGLNDLKIMCEESICEDLSVDNVLESFVIGDVYSCVLKERSKDFIIAHAKELVMRPGFYSIGNLSRPLLVEIFRAVVLQESSNTTNWTIPNCNL